MGLVHLHEYSKPELEKFIANDPESPMPVSLYRQLRDELPDQKNLKSSIQYLKDIVKNQISPGKDLVIIPWTTRLKVVPLNKGTQVEEGLFIHGLEQEFLEQAETGSRPTPRVIFNLDHELIERSAPDCSLRSLKGNSFFSQAYYLPVTKGEANPLGLIGIISQEMDGDSHIAKKENYLISTLWRLYGTQLKKELDPVFDWTGVFKKDFIEQYKSTMLDEARSMRKGIGYIIFDLNDFKSINDTHGHEAGDFALSSFATTLDQLCGVGDYVCHGGGDEFTIFLPGITERDLQVKAGKIGEKMANMKVDYKGVQLDVSSSSHCAHISYQVKNNKEMESKFRDAELLLEQKKNEYYSATGKDRRGRKH